jgi:hypothetical protein
MKNIPGGHNLFVQDKEVATLIENVYSVRIEDMNHCVAMLMLVFVQRCLQAGILIYDMLLYFYVNRNSS